MPQDLQKVQTKLAALRREFDELDGKKLPSDEFKRRFSKLAKQRAELEEELLNLLFAPGGRQLPGAWSGFRQGMLAALRGMEKSLAKSIAAAQPPKPGRWEKCTAYLAKHPASAWLATLLLIYLLLLAVGCLGSGISALCGGAEGAKQLFAFAANPFMGLIVGLLATALVQSSSTTTSIIVALCAAGMPVVSAVPMIMGANVGTSVTNTLVSLGAIGSKRAFRKSFAAATVHDFFNLLAIAIFFPLELFFHPLEKTSAALTGVLYGAGSCDLGKFNFVKAALKPAETFLKHLFQAIPGPEMLGKVLFILFGIALIFATILLLGKLLRGLLTGRAERIFHRAVGRSPVAAIASGMAITVLVQSSSTTTSLIVPLAGAGIMTLKQVYPFTLGANIGTCVTALLAALAFTGAGAAAALQVALIHLLFNTFGVILIYGVRILRDIPPFCAKHLAHAAAEKKAYAFLYVAGVFFALPVLCLLIYRLF